MPAHEHPIPGPRDPRGRKPRRLQRLSRRPERGLHARADERPADPRGGCESAGHTRVQAAGGRFAPAADRGQCERVEERERRLADRHRHRRSKRRRHHWQRRTRNQGNATGVERRAAPEHFPLAELGRTQALQRGRRAGRGRIRGGPAGPDRAHGRGLFQRARGARHARSRAGRARRDRSPARAVRKAVRGRAHCRDRRTGRQGGLRFRHRGADPGQAQPRERRRAAARADRRCLGHAREARQRHAAGRPGSREPGGLGQAGHGPERAAHGEPAGGGRDAAGREHRARRLLPRDRLHRHARRFRRRRELHQPAAA